jgi:hypothetical protein
MQVYLRQPRKRSCYLSGATGVDLEANCGYRSSYEMKWRVHNVGRGSKFCARIDNSESLCAV